MAPITRVDHDAVEQQIKDIIQDLYQVMVQVSTYDSMGGRPSRDVLSNEIQTLSRSLQTLHASTSSSPPAAVLPSVPPELLEYVENGRNPDIYTREFVELVRRGNQLMRGKMHAFGALRDVLAHNITVAMPELRDDVVRAVEATGGAYPRSSASFSAGVSGFGGGAASSFSAGAGGGGGASSGSGSSGTVGNAAGGGGDGSGGNDGSGNGSASVTVTPGPDALSTTTTTTLTAAPAPAADVQAPPAVAQAETDPSGSTNAVAASDDAVPSTS